VVQTEAPPVVSIVIPTFNKWEFTFRCLMALSHNTTDVAHEIIVIDNASSDETAQALPLLDRIRFQRNPANHGFARACNQGAQMARGRYIVFLNNDTEPRAGWLSAMVRVADASPEVAVVGNKLLFPDGTIQHAGVIFGYGVPFPITPFHAHYRRPAAAADTAVELRAVTAACMLIRPAVFSAVGGFDEGFVNGYEDVDLCLKVAMTGAKIAYTPDSVVVHHESVSDGRFACDGANIDRLNQRWLGQLESFEVDVRREIAAAPVAAHTATSVIVPVRDALVTLVPCLESLLRTTATGDEVVLVDDGATGATARIAAWFAARHPDRVRLVRNPRAAGFAAAALQGLEVARAPRAVVMAPSLRVVADWLARLDRHLAANPRLGALLPSLLPVQHLLLKELLYPVGATAGDPAPAPAAPGQVEEVALAAVPLIYGERDRLRELARRSPELLLGDDAGALGAELQAQGLALARAGDVGVYRLAQIAGDGDPRLAARYLIQQGANLAYERRYRAQGQAPLGLLTRAQTELVSIVIVAHGDSAAARACIESVYRHTARSFEVILVDVGGQAGGVDHADADGGDGRLRAYAAAVAERGNLTYLRCGAAHEAGGVARAFNQGLSAARGEYLALLRGDVVVTPGWLSRLLALMAIDPAVALVGPAIGGGAGGGSEGAQDAGMRTYAQLDELPGFAESWALTHLGELALFSPLSGACLVMRRQVVARIGGFDARFADGVHADQDFCVRAARAGFRMAIAFDALVHRASAADRGRAGDERAGGGARAREQAAAAAWQAFCEKWSHPMDARSPVDIRALGGKPFEPTRDFVCLPGLPFEDRQAGQRQVHS
jgi:GT2 family glycosyltransferase